MPRSRPRVSAANGLATGELNYQGGERKTFYDRYPFDPGVSFDSAGVWMATDHLGPLVADRDEGRQTARAAPPRPAAEIRQSFVLNLAYFWIGRFGGALAYFPGVVAAALLFLLAGPRDRVGWLAVLALVASWLGYILIIPDNWYGGAGTIGNRYFLNLVPLGLLLPARAARGGGPRSAPSRRARPSCCRSSSPRCTTRSIPASTRRARPFASCPRSSPCWATCRCSPTSGASAARTTRPAEIPLRRAPGAPPAYFLWFLDDGTLRAGVVVRGGGLLAARQERARTSFSRRSRRPGRSASRSRPAPAGDILTVRLGRERRRLVLAPFRTQEIAFEAPAPALGYYGTSLYRLRFGSRYGGATPKDQRPLGSFVRILLEETGG